MIALYVGLGQKACVRKAHPCVAMHLFMAALISVHTVPCQEEIF